MGSEDILETSSSVHFLRDRYTRETLRKTILRQGRRKFGEPSEQHLDTLKNIKNEEQLENLTDSLLTVSSWDELLQNQPSEF